MGAKPSKTKSKSRRTTAPIPIPPRYVTTPNSESEAFLENLKSRTEAGRRWCLFLGKSASHVGSIPFMTRMYIKLVGTDSVMLCFASYPIEFAPDIDDTNIHQYHAPILVAGSQIYLSAKFHYDMHPKFTMTLTRIRGDLVYAYEGHLKIAGTIYTVYLCHAPSLVIPRYIKLRRDDTTMVEGKTRIFWQMGEHPARFIRWEGDGHVVVKSSSLPETTLFIKDCYVQTNGH